MSNREFQYWTPKPIFAGETVFCLASGPSLTQGIVNRLHDRRIIVVNSSCLLVLEAGITDAVLYFTDSGWYEDRRDLVANWPGLIISMSRTAKRELPDKVLRVKGEGDPNLPPLFPLRWSMDIQQMVIQQGRSSGHTAVSLALALGANRVVLLGYDMRTVDGREHHHNEYAGPRDLDQYAREFVPAFAGWDAAARSVGVEIVNCTAGSAITEFPFADLNEVLACSQP